MMNFVTYSDGTNDLADISKPIGEPVRQLARLADTQAAPGEWLRQARLYPS